MGRQKEREALSKQDKEELEDTAGGFANFALAMLILAISLLGAGIFLSLFFLVVEKLFGAQPPIQIFSVDALKTMLFIAIPLIILLTLVSTYNSLVKQRNRLDEKFATMDIYLTKRHALIPSLVSVVKGYAKHESQTLSEVAQARNLAQKAHGSEQQIKEENMLSRGITNLFAIVERYPELKADKQFISLQQELIKLKKKLQTQEKNIMNL